MNKRTAREEIQGKIEYNLDNLQETALHLSDNMLRLVDRIQRDRADASINGLGEVQSLGQQIDVLCARIEALRIAKSYLDEER